MTELRAFGVVSMRTQNDDSKFVITSRVSSRTREDGEGPHERSMTARCSLCDPPAWARSLPGARDDKPKATRTCQQDADATLFFVRGFFLRLAFQKRDLFDPR